MNATHEHAHDHVHVPRSRPVQAGISLLRLSAPGRLAIAFAFSVLIWLIVYLVVR
jgi:hypothetical protein